MAYDRNAPEARRRRAPEARRNTGARVARRTLPPAVPPVAVPMTFPGRTAVAVMAPHRTGEPAPSTLGSRGVVTAGPLFPAALVRARPYPGTRVPAPSPDAGRP
ncbi:hypothetical protein [Streptomyces sp. NPDC048637]|uniref:hypothetical protein n=1 Tax=Streptomyces sp. NPDC048637 TaxID=3155636 RepID=UPI00342B22C4